MKNSQRVFLAFTAMLALVAMPCPSARARSGCGKRLRNRLQSLHRSGRSAWQPGRARNTRPTWHGRRFLRRGLDIGRRSWPHDHRQVSRARIFCPPCAELVGRGSMAFGWNGNLFISSDPTITSAGGVNEYAPASGNGIPNINFVRNAIPYAMGTVQPFNITFDPAFNSGNPAMMTGVLYLHVVTGSTTSTTIRYLEQPLVAIAQDNTFSAAAGGTMHIRPGDDTLFIDNGNSITLRSGYRRLPWHVPHQFPGKPSRVSPSPRTISHFRPDSRRERHNHRPTFQRQRHSRRHGTYL